MTAPQNISVPNGRNTIVPLWVGCDWRVIIAKKNPITRVTISYIGTSSDFETFLKTIVRDYLAADNPAEIPEAVFVDKVESENN